MNTKPPDEYEGQLLCPRCGDDGTGTRFQICAEREPLGWRTSHAESCERYRYADDICAACEKFYEQEEAHD